MTLYLDPLQLQSILDAAERTYPEECCGLLVGWQRPLEGTSEGTASEKVVVAVKSFDNTWTPTVDAPDTADASGAPDTTVALPSASRSDTATQPWATDLDKTRRYWIAPEDLLATMREAREQDLEVIGVYHSHPDHPSVPSDCDRQLAWPSYSYVIVSVQQGCAQTWQSWTLDDTHQFQLESIALDRAGILRRAM